MDSVVHRVAKSWTRLNDFKFAFNTLKDTLISMFFDVNPLLFLFCETIKCKPGRYNTCNIHILHVLYYNIGESQMK